MRNQHRSPSLSRRSLLTRGSATLATAAMALAPNKATWATTRQPDSAKVCEGEILGQGDFRYRANRFWGVLDRQRYPVQDCHGISEDRHGRIVTLTNHARNNLIAYEKGGDSSLPGRRASLAPTVSTSLIMGAKINTGSPTRPVRWFQYARPRGKNYCT